MEVKEYVKGLIDKYEHTFDKNVADALRLIFVDNCDWILKKITDQAPTVGEVNAMIEKNLKEYFPDASKEELEKRRQFLREVYIEGKNMGEAMGFTLEQKDALYALGYHNYNNGKYDEARKFFCFLTLLDNKDSRYLFASGAAYHMLKDYPSAITFYSLCTYQDWLNPLPWYHLADCYIQTKQYKEACNALENMIRRCGKDKMYKKICERSKLLQESLQSQLTKENL